MLDEIERLRNHISCSSTQINQNQSAIQKLKKYCFADEAEILEFEKLRCHYSKELSQKKMVSTYADFLEQLPQLSCPVCRQTINPAIIDHQESEKLFEYFKNCVLQLQLKIQELAHSIEDIRARLNDHKAQIEALAEENKKLSESISESQAALSTLSRNISIIRQLDKMNKSLEIYRKELSSVESDIVIYSEKVKKEQKKRLLQLLHCI